MLFNTEFLGRCGSGFFPNVTAHGPKDPKGWADHTAGPRYRSIYTAKLSSFLHTVGYVCSFSSWTQGGAVDRVPRQSWQAALWRLGGPSTLQSLYLWQSDSLVVSARAPRLLFVIPAPPIPVPLSSLHWEKVRPWAHAPRCAAQARGAPYLARISWRRITCMLPPRSSCPPLLQVSPHL